MFVLANRPGFPFLGNNLFVECGDVFYTAWEDAMRTLVKVFPKRFSMLWVNFAVARVLASRPRELFARS